jgi:Helix-turn-helix domain
MTRAIETTSPEKRSALQAILKALPGVSVGQQRARILQALQIGPITTFEASRYLDSYYPPVRISELRDQGHDIVLHWVRIATEAGQVHRIGQYVLTPKGAA